nr:hypothetical protein [Micromonospora sp. DSM 115978]
LRPGGSAVVTTPNAARLVNLFATLCGLELIHPDHVALYSWRTLAVLLDRADWDVGEFCLYRLPASPNLRWRKSPAVCAGLALQRAATRWRPFLADGLIVVAAPR